MEPTQGAGALSSNTGGLSESEKAPVISLSVILGLMCCCGIGYYIFVYYRRAKEQEENDEKLTPYERWMRNEELKARGASTIQFIGDNSTKISRSHPIFC